MDIKTRLGSLIRHYRKQKGYTLTQFAEMLHKSKSSISKYEHGEVAVDIETLHAIAQALGIPARLLVEEPNRLAVSMPHPLATPQQQQTSLLYMYHWNGSSRQPLRRSVLLMGESTAALYMDVADYSNYIHCAYQYHGEVQRFDASVRVLLANPINERDLVLINFTDPLNNHHAFYGFFSSFSIGPFQPFSTKCVVSSSAINDIETLKSMLLMSKEELREFRQLNMFQATVQSYVV